MLAKQTQERIDLYAARHPPGEMLPFHVDPTPVPDAAPMDSELRMVVGQLRNGHTAGTMGMKAEHLKEWLANITLEEREEGGVEGLGDHWRSFVALLQALWTTGTVPTQMTWMIVVLLPKGGGSFCGIGLLNPIWTWLRKLPTCQQHVAPTAKCHHILPKCPCQGDTILIPTHFLCRICRHPPNFPL